MGGAASAGFIGVQRAEAYLFHHAAPAVATAPTATVATSANTPTLTPQSTYSGYGTTGFPAFSAAQVGDFA